MGASASGQTGNIGSPIVFENGNTIDVSTFAQQGTPDNSTYVINPVQVLGSGGTLTNSQYMNGHFSGGISGTGQLTLNFASTNVFFAVGSGGPYPPVHPR